LFLPCISAVKVYNSAEIVKIGCVLVMVFCAGMGGTAGLIETADTIAGNPKSATKDNEV
jgi:hypothetical protein